MRELSRETQEKLHKQREELLGLDELFFKCGLCGGEVSGFCIGTKLQEDDLIWLGVSLVKDAKIVKDWGVERTFFAGNVQRMLSVAESLDDELDDEIAVIRGEIWDNCRDWCYKCKIVYPENENERTVTHCKCGRVLGFIPKAGIDEYLKTLDPEEREAREKGIWKHLSGLVYKELDRSLHIYDDFPVPKSWMKIESIDPHDARETHWAFGAVSPEEIEIFGKKRHRIYWFDTLLLKGSVEDMAKQVKSLRALHSYTEPKAVVLDRKMGEKTQMEGISWEGRLGQAGIGHIRLSQSAPGDVELGHKIVRAYLVPQYSSLIQKSKPGMLFAKKGCGGQKGLIRYMFNYQYDEDSQKPKEEYKDWPDCIRYAALEQFVYRSPEDEAGIVQGIEDRMKEVYAARRR